MKKLSLVSFAIICFFSTWSRAEVCQLQYLPQTNPVPYLESLPTTDDYRKLLATLAQSDYVKYAVDQKPGGQKPEGENDLFFQNTAIYKMHLPFLSTLPRFKGLDAAAYEKLIFAGEAKRISAGAVYWRPCLELPDFPEAKGFLGFSLYYKGGLDAAEVKLVYEKLKQKVVFAGEKIIFVFENKPDYFKYKLILKQAGISSVPLEKLAQVQSSTIVYHAAKSYGYLRKLSLKEFDKGDYTSKDILIMEQVPLDIGPLAGLISLQPLGPNSHVILRAANQNIPCAYIAVDQLQPPTGHLVEFETREDGDFRIKGEKDFAPGELEVLAKEYFLNRVPKLPPLKFDLQNRDFLAWQSMTPQTQWAQIYGAKATNFAFIDSVLSKAGFDRAIFAGGFAVPFSYYKDHLEQLVKPVACQEVGAKCLKKGYAQCEQAQSKCQAITSSPYPSIKSFIEQFVLGDPTLLSEGEKRKTALFFAQEMIKAHPLSKLNLEAIKLAIQKYPATTRMRLRSSTNAEDLAGLNGAGLYESEQACLADESNAGSVGSLCMTNTERSRIQSLIDQLKKLGPTENQEQIKKLEEKLKKTWPLENAIKKVYASIWGERAFLYRDYFQIPHQDVFMGLLVAPSYADETADGVAILDLSKDALTANIVVQEGDVSITNPEVPGAVPDQMVVSIFANGLVSLPQFLTRSNLTQGEPVLNEDQLKELMKQFQAVAKLFSEFQGLKDQRLDVEFKADDKGTIILKQMRPLN